FFPEKRPFFVVGVDIFRFGLGLGDGDLGNESLFYSRRIGRAPQGDVDGDYTDAPDATTIVAAAKLSGKTQSGWSIGILDAVTAEEHGAYVLDGVEGETAIEPLTNYGVARVIKDFRDGRSAVGGIFTATNRSLPSGGGLDWLRRSAYTGGIDFRHRFLDERYQVTGSVVGSHVTGSPDAIDAVQTSPVHYFQRPDADYVEYDPARTSLQGVAAKAELFKIQGKWRWALLGMTLTPGFEANDLGFQTNGDLALGVLWVGFNEYEPGDLLRRWNVGTNLWTGTNYGGDRVSLGGNVNGSFQLQSFWGGFGGINVEAPTYSSSMLRGGPSFLRPASGNAYAGVYTDDRKPVSLSMHVRGSWEEGIGAAGWSVGPGLEVRPSDNADLFLGPSFSRSRTALQYVTTEEVDGADQWILGTVDRTTLSMTARLNYTFSPTLSLQLYAQPYLGTGDYDDFKGVTDPRAADLADRFRVFGDGEITASTVDGDREYAVDLNGDATADLTFGDPDFNFKQLRSNVVLRWEYRPGSAIFLVWSQGRTDFSADGRFRFDRDVDALLGADGTNVLLVKMSYWLGL
ncbi:MAG: DUF5916 domain-containing protein, partial [Gemmatimonadota bacterium]